MILAEGWCPRCQRRSIFAEAYEDFPPGVTTDHQRRALSDGLFSSCASCGGETEVLYLTPAMRDELARIRALPLTGGLDV